MLPPVARRFVAGETVASVLEHARELHTDGIGTICNLLGEHYDTRELAREDVEVYRDLLAGLGSTDLDACISVKPTQLGLDVGEPVFREHLEMVVDAAATHGGFVWLDMEDHTTTDATLDAFAESVVDYPRVGVCLQANLRRTPADLERLAELPGKVRLVKGAYDEPSSVAYTDKRRVNAAYRELIETGFREYGDGVAVGSHDPEMIALARELGEAHGADYEVQMLMGVREDAQRELAADDVTVYQYAPFGDRWLSYFYRRLAERTENITFALRAILRG